VIHTTYLTNRLGRLMVHNLILVPVRADSLSEFNEGCKTLSLIGPFVTMMSVCKI
jgi:hypothetical protein